MDDRLFIDLERIEMEFRRLIDNDIEIREMTIGEIFDLMFYYGVEM